MALALLIRLQCDDSWEDVARDLLPTLCRWGMSQVVPSEVLIRSQANDELLSYPLEKGVDICVSVPDYICIQVGKSIADSASRQMGRYWRDENGRTFVRLLQLEWEKLLLERRVR